MTHQNNREISGGFLNILSFHEVCRTCLQEISTTNIGFPIQGSKFQAIAFKEILELHAQIQITEDDYLPQKICANCVFNLCTMHTFSMKCKKSDQILRSSLVHGKEKKASQLSEKSTKNVPCSTEAIVQQDSQQNYESKHEASQDHIENSVNYCGSKIDSPDSEIIVAQEHFESSKRGMFENRVIKMFDSKEKTQKKHKQQPYKCTECNKLLKSRSSLRDHRLCHIDAKSFVCEFCGKAFKRPQQLRLHFNSHHGHTSFTCSDCGHSFANMVYLKQHQKFHGAKNFLCSECGKAFTRRDDLAIHNRIHTKEALYHCTVCSKSFIDPGGWSRHKRIHTGERPYRCTVCAMCFRLSGNLKRHMMLHTGEKPHKCIVCDKTFTSRHLLGTHIGKHAGKALLESATFHKT